MFILTDYFDDLQKIANVGFNDFFSVVEDVCRVCRRPLSKEPSSPNTRALQFRRTRSKYISGGTMELSKDNCIRHEFLREEKKRWGQRHKIPSTRNSLKLETFKLPLRSSILVLTIHLPHNGPSLL